MGAERGCSGPTVSLLTPAVLLPGDEKFAWDAGELLGD